MATWLFCAFQNICAATAILGREKNLKNVASTIFHLKLGPPPRQGGGAFIKSGDLPALRPYVNQDDTWLSITPFPQPGSFVFSGDHLASSLESFFTHIKTQDSDTCPTYLHNIIFSHRCLYVEPGKDAQDGGGKKRPQLSYKSVDPNSPFTPTCGSSQNKTSHPKRYQRKI